MHGFTLVLYQCGEISDRSTDCWSWGNDYPALMIMIHDGLCPVSSLGGGSRLFSFLIVSFHSMKKRLAKCYSPWEKLIFAVFESDLEEVMLLRLVFDANHWLSHEMGTRAHSSLLPQTVSKQVRLFLKTLDLAGGIGCYWQRCAVDKVAQLIR